MMQLPGKNGLITFGGGGGGTSVSLIHPEVLYDIDFARGQWYGALPSNLVVQRAREALTQTTATGPYVLHATDVARITGNGLMIEEARMNSIRNPRGSGAGAGVVPTNWSIPGVADGTTGAVVGAITLAGLPGVRAQWSGTSGTSGTVTICAFDAANVIPAVNGQTWVGSVVLALASGSFANVTSIALRVQGMDSGGSAVSGQSFDTSIIGLSGTPTTFTVSTTFSDPAVAFVRLSLVANWANSLPVNFALDIAAPFLRQGTFAGSPILNADGVTSSATTQPADVVYLPISGVGTEYTIYCEAAAPLSQLAAIELWASANDRASLRPNVSTLGAVVTSGGVNQAFAANPTYSTGRKGALRVKSGDTRLVADGTLGASASAGLAPAVAPTRAYIGSANGGISTYYNNFIRRVAIIPRVLSDAELQTLTT